MAAATRRYQPVHPTSWQSQVWLDAMMRLFVLLALYCATARAHEKTIDQEITEVLQKEHVKVKPVIELENGKFLYDLDEVLTPTQFKEIYGKDPKSKRFTVRAAAYGHNLWSNNVIPFSLDHTYNNQRDANLVQNAMRELERGTCIRFKHRSREQNYIQFIDDQGCYSMIGMIGGKQHLSLGKRGCRFRGTILHELLHALGIVHEQTRPDRDNFVRILTRNVQRGMESQFTKSKKEWINYHGVPYDFSSIMHYGLTSFTKNGRKTIEPISDPNAERYIPGYDHYGLSFGDYKLVNSMYGCNQHCSNSCNGYLDRDCRCVEIDGFYREHCRGNEQDGWCFKYSQSRGRR